MSIALRGVSSVARVLNSVVWCVANAGLALCLPRGLSCVRRLEGKKPLLGGVPMPSMGTPSPERHRRLGTVQRMNVSRQRQWDGRSGGESRLYDYASSSEEDESSGEESEEEQTSSGSEMEQREGQSDDDGDGDDNDVEQVTPRVS
jgi:hypothetical protein